MIHSYMIVVDLLHVIVLYIIEIEILRQNNKIIMIDIIMDKCIKELNAYTLTHNPGT